MNTQAVYLRRGGGTDRALDERGEGTLRTICWVAAILYALYASVVLIHARTDDYRLERRVEEVLKFADSHEHFWQVEDVRFQIGRTVRELGIPIDPEEIEIDADKRQWRVAIAYGRDLDLVFFTHHQAVVLDRTESR